MGVAKVKESAGAAEACDPLAGGEHDRSATGSRRVDRAAQVEAARAGVHPTVCGGGRAEPSVRGFQAWFKTRTLKWLEGKRKIPLALHPIPSNHKNKECQGCARFKMSTMSPNGYSFAPMGRGGETLAGSLVHGRSFGGVFWGTLHEEGHGREECDGDGHDGDYIAVGEDGGLLLQ